MRRFGLYGDFAVCLLMSTLFLKLALAQEADDWTELDANGITDTLTGITLDYDAAWQDFRASGNTLYNAGENSWGNWRVENDQYCSQWPPRDLWDCYDVARADDQIRFTGVFDDVSIGVIRK